MERFPDVSEARLDLLKELANIGVGNATTSLSQILNDQKIIMNVPEVSVVPLQNITEYLEEEKPTAAIFFEARNEEFNLIVMFILSKESALLLANRILKTNSDTLGEMERSALLEVGNIFNSAYLNALSSVTSLTFIPTPPALVVDMGGAIIGTVIAESRMIEDYLILSSTSIFTEKEDISANIFVFPYYGSMDYIFKSMGVN